MLWIIANIFSIIQSRNCIMNFKSMYQLSATLTRLEMKYLPKFVANFSFAWRILIWSQNSTCHRISTNTIFIKCDKIPSWFQYWTGGYVICTHWNVFNCLFDFSYQWLFKTFHIWLKWISSKLNSKPSLSEFKIAFYL